LKTDHLTTCWDFWLIQTLSNGLSSKESNPVSHNDPTMMPVSKDAVPNIVPDPDHSHEAVMRQLFFSNPPYPTLNKANNQGFVWDFAKRIDSKKKKIYEIQEFDSEDEMHNYLMDISDKVQQFSS